MATILLIDDHRAVREMLEMAFAEEHECHTADRAEQALELIEFEKYDLIITDISMPGLGGLEILRRVKQRHTTPVIVISGRADKYQDAVLKIGAYAFFAKPFSLGALEASVSDALAAKGTQTLTN